METNKKVRNLVLASLLLAITIVLSRFVSVMLPIFGSQSLKISFSGIPLKIAGILLGPVYGGIVGALSDLIGYVLNSFGGVYFPGFTLTSLLAGLVPGLVYMYVIKNKKINFKVLSTVLYGLFLAGSIYYVFSTEKIGKLVLNTNIKLTLSLILIMIFVVVQFFVFKFKSNIAGNNKILTFEQSIVIVLITTVCSSLILNPIWLNKLYGIPVVASIYIRIFKSSLLMPLNAFILTVVINRINFK